MFAVNFYTSCFVSRKNSIGKKVIIFDWEKAVYRPLFTLANTLMVYFGLFESFFCIYWGKKTK